MTPVNARPIPTLLALIVALGAGSCAVGGFVPQTPTMPAAREALRPEYRIFYDALQDYGDWVLIEPYGFVFRPRVDFATFRPYREGFWAASDPWGWVWISGEPFGWITYHYGTWFWDRFQGWVWAPGVDWGPGWVSWEIAGDFAGWAPLGPSGSAIAAAPGGPYLFAPLERLGTTDLRAHAVTREELGAAARQARPLDNVVEREGVRYQFGPEFAAVERARGGPLTKVTLEGIPSAPAGTVQPLEETVESPTAPSIGASREAAAAAARQARSLAQHGGQAPSRIALPRPAVMPAAAGGADSVKMPRPAPPRAAEADSTR